MRYELRRYKYEIFFDILLLEGCKIIFYYWERVRSMRYELRRYRYEISFDILSLGGCKNDFFFVGKE